MDQRNKTCCFTGHRNIPHNTVQSLSRELEQVMRELIASGICDFLAGGARGFDTLAAETVLCLRKEFANIRLILALPCRDQTKGWKVGDIRRYEAVLSQADEVIYVSETYTRGCMHRRNRYLADHSAICIAYCTRDSGGSAYTVKYARRKGLKIIPLDEK